MTEPKPPVDYENVDPLSFLYPQEEKPSQKLQWMLLLPAVVACVMAVFTGYELFGVFFLGQTHNVRGHIERVYTPQTRSRRYDSRTVYFKLSGSPYYFQLPSFLITTPYEYQMRAAKVADITYGGPRYTRPPLGSYRWSSPGRPAQGGEISYYGVSAIALDGEPYLTSTSYVVERAMQALFFLAVFAAAAYAGLRQIFTKSG